MYENSKDPQSNQAGGKRRAVGGFGAAMMPTHPERVGTDGGGAPLSNTAPSNCTDFLSDVSILRSGIDSLYVSCPGQITPEMEDRLQCLKESAQSVVAELRASAYLDLEGHRFEVKAQGKGLYSFCLVDNWFHLQISSRGSESLPMLYAQIRSEVLTCEGVKPVLLKLVRIAQALDSAAGGFQVSRVDVCTDFVTKLDPGKFPQEWWVGRIAKLNRYSEHGRFSGYTFGAGGDLSCRLYDKTLELTKSKKEYFYQVWTLNGWDLESKVWRLEFQFKRPVLKELDVCGVTDLLGDLAGLWDYATREWLQLKLPSLDQTRSRWPTNPFWVCLQEADWGEIDRHLWRVKTEREPQKHQLFVNGLGALSSYMAMTGVVDVDTGVQRFIRDARRYHVTRKGYERALDDHLLEKINEKAKRFNKIRSESSGEPESE
ncbi:replication initiation factor [Spongiibacter sp. KMU-158]|uniref:Replication initiation factor n=1 Tax=Spongiibacter pelagi TaxID=2760804 RepID=A0A927C375_9GAMM|nr:replication initiation factor [Spongiibacter pelagi]MBD2859959.1 replication initiation factor [Spongiibacter pelagi]